MENSIVNDELSTQEWFKDYVDDEEELQVMEYDITATPNDFNVSTLFNFIESGAVVIPGFQRSGCEFSVVQTLLALVIMQAHTGIRDWCRQKNA